MANVGRFIFAVVGFVTSFFPTLRYGYISGVDGALWLKWRSGAAI